MIRCSGVLIFIYKFDIDLYVRKQILFLGYINCSSNFSHESSLFLQMVQRNGNAGFRYMQNGRNTVDQSMLPQTQFGPIMPVPVNVNGMAAIPMDVARTSSVPIPTLASALASATPEDQRAVGIV